MKDTRTTVFKKFCSLLKEDDSKRLEQHIYNFIINYIDTKKINKNFMKDFYMNKSFQIFSNLKKNSYINNEHLPKLIENNKLNVDTVVDLPMKKVRPKKWNKYKEDLDILNKEISNFDTKVTTTDQFTCGKCKQNETYYTSVQLRSSDEPMTQFIVCINCGNNWREG